MQRLIHFILLMVNGLTWMCAQVQVSGVVLDANNRQPLAGATVSQAGQASATADAQGRFSLTAASLPVRLTAEAPGYEPRTLEVTDLRGVVTIPLPPTGYQLEEVAIAAYYTGRSLMRQSGSVGVITPRDLARDNQVVITPALNRIPGVYMHSGTYGTHRITIRGIGSRTPFGTTKIRAYLNDIPLTGGDGETSLEDIDLSLIGRVEVLKGPASSLYGAGLGGTILMSATQPEAEAPSGTLSGTAGSAGLYRTTARYTTFNPQESYQLSGHYTRSTGWRDNSAYTRYGTLSLTETRVGDGGSMTTLTLFTTVEGQIPSSIDSTTYTDRPEAAAPTWLRTAGNEAYHRLLIGNSYHYYIGKHWEGNSTGFAGFRGNNEVRPFNLLRENNYWGGLRNWLRLKAQLGGRPFQLTGGFESYTEWYNWQLYTNVGGTGGLGGVLGDNQEVRATQNLFAQALWDLSDRTSLTAGLNGNSTRYTYKDRFVADSTDRSGQYAYDPVFSPRIALVHTLRPNVVLRASASHGFSPPTVAETLTPEGSINPDIQPETGWSFETGARIRLWEQRIFADLGLYHMPIQNLLVAERLQNDELIGRNAGQTRHDGAEISVTALLLERRGSRLDVSAQYHLARYRFVSFVDRGRDYSGNVLTGVPPVTGSASLDWTLRWGLFGNVNVYYAAGMPVTDDNSRYTDAYTLCNSQLGFKRILGKHHSLRLLAGVQNLLDARYAAMIQVNAPSTGGGAPRYFYPGQPRNVYTQLSYTLTL
ncbi:MAG: TonB-dependent receptor [Bacteroidia bacterium]|nr:TonB-dependent receptor [Bacteroidia bacterium]